MNTSQRLAALLSTGLLLAVLWPVRLNWTAQPTDSFPLSYYPMFSHDRQGHAEITYLLGVQASGQRQYLPYSLAGTGGMNQVRKVIAKRARKNPARLCAQVARRVARTAGLDSIRTVKVVRSTFTFSRFFAGDQTPDRSQVLCSCAVL